MDGVLGALAGMAGVVAAIGVVVYHREILQGARRLAARAWPQPPPPPTATGRPIERIARDARRLRAEVRTGARGMPAARRAGLVRAYDDLLAEACQALGVPDTLTDADPRQRDVERLRVEAALDRAGLRLDG